MSKQTQTIPMPAVSIDPAFGYLFPAIRGIQSNREYYVSMCPLRLLPKMFLFDEAELVPELRAQRTLNKSRLPEIAEYILQNRDSYVFSAITASIDGEVKFQSFGDAGDINARLGILQVPMDARFIINDGQHRRAAIELALREEPEIGNESIAVVFFVDRGLARSQQMFADLNLHAVRPSRSLGVLYNHRDDRAALVRTLVVKSPMFRDIVEMERSTLSERSRRLFTLSAIYHATCALLKDVKSESAEEVLTLGTSFWETVGKQFPEWELVRSNKITAGDVRRDFIHSHAVVLHALGTVGNCLLTKAPKTLQEKLKVLKKLDWSRSNSKLWEGRAMVGGRVSKSGNNVILTNNLIKTKLGLSLSPEEQRIEDAFERGKDGR